jgi:hypothetical protein
VNDLVQDKWHHPDVELGGKDVWRLKKINKGFTRIIFLPRALMRKFTSVSIAESRTAAPNA